MVRVPAPGQKERGGAFPPRPDPTELR